MALQHLLASSAAGDLGGRSGRYGSGRHHSSGEVRLSIRAAAVVFFALFVSPSSGLAQEGPVSFGVLAGANVADQTGEDVFTPHDRFGFIGGVSGAYRFASRWSIQLDGLFVQKGGRENNDNDPGDLADNRADRTGSCRETCPPSGSPSARGCTPVWVRTWTEDWFRAPTSTLRLISTAASL